MTRFYLFVSSFVLFLTVCTCNSTLAAQDLVIQNDDTLEYEIDWAIMEKKGPSFWEGKQQASQEDVFPPGKEFTYSSRDLMNNEQYHIWIKRPLTSEEEANRPSHIPMSADFLYCSYIVPKGKWKVSVSEIIENWKNTIPK